jgi:diguanylate cyclase (GGDEF)-like protein
MAGIFGWLRPATASYDSRQGGSLTMSLVAALRAGLVRRGWLPELALVSLAGIGAYLAVTSPWLCLLVIVPMAALLRGVIGRELEAAARVDAKTGLLNAVAWEELTRRELIRSRRTGGAVAVLIVDIDRFKLINDRYGHLAGDAVLRDIAGALANGVRASDVVGRFGGEEFVVVLPGAGSREALRIAERLRARIRELGVAGTDDRPLSVSIGVACAPLDGIALDDLLLAADAALYRAKECGRDRVLLADRGRGTDPLHS